MFELENGCGKGRSSCSAKGTCEEKQGGTSRRAGGLREDEKRHASQGCTQDCMTVQGQIVLFLGQAVGLRAARQALRLQSETGSLQTATNEAGPRCAPHAARSLQTAKEPSFGRASV